MFVSGKSHHKLLELHEKYGLIVRLGPNELSYIVPEAWEDVMGPHKAGKRSENPKAPWYCSPKNKDIIGAPHEGHARMRRLMSNGFSAGAMLGQQPLIKGHVDLLIQRLCEKADNGKATIDIHAWCNYCTFDIIGDLAFGEAFGCLRESAMHPWISLVFANIKLTAIILVCNRISVFFIFLPFFVSRKLWRQFMEHQKVFRGKVAKRLALKEARPDFIQYMTSGKAGLVGFNQLPFSATDRRYMSLSQFSYIIFIPVPFSRGTRQQCRDLNPSRLRDNSHCFGWSNIPNRNQPSGKGQAHKRIASKL